MKIYIGSDHGGFLLKQEIMQALNHKKGIKVVDVGTHSTEMIDFPDVVPPVVDGVLKDQATGILVCGSGIGMSIAANRYKGIRAALAHSAEYASFARYHNDANILCLGGRFVSTPLALSIVDTFLGTSLSEDPKYKRRMNVIDGWKR